MPPYADREVAVFWNEDPNCYVECDQHTKFGEDLRVYRTADTIGGHPWCLCTTIEAWQGDISC
ncbi:hypothetical protein FKW77_004218 [Venturia effusa]|uniref:Uncharacterized protein n=1 Tax=Venturia effusa TaxID=50376 RepID=A0A517L151_9PEZI|nr:hypothetical protein FKW77_004218 [Venturia effusa]